MKTNKEDRVVREERIEYINDDHIITHRTDGRTLIIKGTPSVETVKIYRNIIACKKS
ncbi:hypothetical protein SAMN04488542_10584 [Fontibacillus panacisegetis]|uniref:Uncharacterized protein n=1 Tax=Fontibacillus panacisegetis TaxID=670482 RepID=A0A1G7HZ88_9BACL|nr:hypothetical protein [Fontibacillus panacisegetis]SDF05464.1 hypothetical protein SAMN04488542_10584 [Fontibacillus panacisegetis]